MTPTTTSSSPAPNAPRELQFPLYVKAPLVLLGLAFLVLILHLASEIIYPLIFAVIFAILLHPVEQWLLRRRVPALLAISLTVLLGMLALLGLFYFIYLETRQLSEHLPLFKAKLGQMMAQVHEWLRTRFGVTDDGLRTAAGEVGTRASGLVGGTLAALTRVLVGASLVPVYVFLLFLYQRRLMDFLIAVFSARRTDDKVTTVLRESKAAIQSYMVGLLIEGTIVAVLNVSALLLLGIPYALLLGVVGALVNFIPYIGGLTAIALPVLMAFVTKDSLAYPLGVVAIYVVIQFVDNHYLIPRIVASKIKVNALVAIVGVLAGNALGGVAGMFLALPVIAILKIIFDRIDSLKPWGLLLGDEETPRGRPVNPVSPATRTAEAEVALAE